MTWETRPVTKDRFEDFADVINRNRRVNHCWCLSHRLQAAEIEELGDGRREEAVRRLCGREHPPGVVAYPGRRSIVCVVVRAGDRRQGVTAPLREGAVA
ncbi:MAG: hypothetical protein WAW88_01160 [Nocardioides sp.]